LKERIVSQLTQEKITSVLIDKELLEEDVEKIKELHLL
jgi:hypothetical protein